MQAGQSTSFTRSTNGRKQFRFWKTQCCYCLKTFHYTMNKLIVQTRILVLWQLYYLVHNTTVAALSQMFRNCAQHCLHKYLALQIWQLLEAEQFLGHMALKQERWEDCKICQQCEAFRSEERSSWKQINKLPQENCYWGYEGTDLSIQAEETQALQKR